MRPPEIPGFDQLSPIGEGGFGTVYRARQTSVDRPVALKVLSNVASDPENVDRFTRECTAAGSLSDHPNVVTVYDAGIHGNDAYIAMELLTGGSLLDRVGQGPIPVAEAVATVAAAAEAVDAAHNIGLLHRDIKPGNILIGRDGTPKLADFGIASLLTAESTTTGRSVSISYAAPELLQGGTASVRSDVYALGATLYHLVSGEPPFYAGGNLGAAALQAVTEELPPLPGAPAALQEVVADSLSKEIGRRPGSASEFARLIRNAIEHHDPSPAPAGQPAAAATAVRTSDDPASVSEGPSGGRPIVPIAVGVAVVVALLAFLATRGSDGGDENVASATSTTTSTTAQATSSTTDGVEAPSALVDEPLLDFEPRSATFANLDFEILDVRVTNRSLRSYADGSEPEIDSNGDHFAILDMRVTNTLGSTQVGADDGWFNLEVDGRKLPIESSFLSDVPGYHEANTSTESFLAFTVDEGTDLADAALVIGAPPDRQVRIPLTGELEESDYPIRLEVEATATGTGPTNGGTIEFTLREVLLTLDLPQERLNSPSGQRADVDEVFLRLHVEAEKIEGRGDDLLTVLDGFRLLIDGRPIAPFDSANDPAGSNGYPTATPGAVVDAWVLFSLPTDAETVALQVGAVDDEPGVIPFELPELPER